MTLATNFYILRMLFYLGRDLISFVMRDQVIGKKGRLLIMRCWYGLCERDAKDFGCSGVGSCDLLDWIPETEYLQIYIKIIN